MLKLFLKLELGRGPKYFRSNKVAKAITIYLFLAVFLLIGFGIYRFFLSAFNYLDANIEESIRIALTLFFYELFLLVLSGIIVFSCIVSSIFRLFRGRSDNWIMGSPSYKRFPMMIFLRSCLISMWPLFAVFLPAILAFTKVYDLGAVSLFFILLSFFLLLVHLNAATIAVIIATGSGYFAIARKLPFLRFGFRGLITVILALFLGLAYFVWDKIKGIDIVKLFGDNDAKASDGISLVKDYFNLFPTHSISSQIVNWQMIEPAAAFFDFSVIFILAGVSVFLLGRISFLFYSSWQKFQEVSARTDGKASVRLDHPVVRFTGGKVMALFKKEALVSSRNVKGVLWFFFLFFIWLSQIGTNVFLKNNLQRYETDLEQKVAIIQSLQFIIAVYFICSFVLRFVFPAFSVEKKTAWILASAPLNFKRIFFGKYLFYSLFFVPLGIIMSYINAGILDLPVKNAAYATLLFVLVVIFIVTLGLSLGAIFPNSETDDPEIISTSMPGLFFTAFSLIYGALGDAALYHMLLGGNIANLIFFVAMTFVLIAIMLWKTPDLVNNKYFS